MEITLKEVTIREVVEGYENNNEEGIFGYNGLLDIRPPYQREFVYNPAQRNAVVETIKKGLPLNVMYWNKNDDGTYEIMDGQQRTISFCSYVNGDYPIDFQYFHNLTEEEQEDILDYELMIYTTEGTDRQKLDWFKIINIAGVKLSDQELRNAVYTGPWLEDAKRYFSKTSCAAYNLGKDYMRGVPIRQDYLQTVIQWHKNDDEAIEEYMARNQNEEHASELWMFYQSIISWVNRVFTQTRKEMKGQPWGLFYKQHKDDSFNPVTVEEEIKELMKDIDVTNKRGIYPYILDRNENNLNIRRFNERQKRETYEEQEGICAICKEEFAYENMEADHITPWSEGGETVKENCQMLCVRCNREKAAS